MNIPFIKYSKIWLIFSAVIAALCLVVLFMWGLKPGIDFTGGSLVELSFEKNRPNITEAQKVFDELDLKNAVLQPAGARELVVRTSFLSEEKHQEILKKFSDTFGQDNKITEKSFETIGPSISQQLRRRSLWAIILVSLGIILYIAYAFRKVSRPVASWKYGALAIAGVMHDLLLVIGIFSVLGHFRGVEVDTAFIVALLTILGYSIHDNIVVYDRIRENLLRHSVGTFAETVNFGLNQTLMRSINTTVATLLPLIALYIFGGATVHYFVLALIIGIASGAYSSIFIASPLLAMVEAWQRKKAAAART